MTNLWFILFFVLYRKTLGNCEKSLENCSLPSWQANIHSLTAKTWSNKNKTTIGKVSGQPRSAEGKLMMLGALEDSIIHEARKRLMTLGNRQARTKGMGSKEGALVTISLLTFAVYLIKLVKKLINHLHTKNNDQEMMALNLNGRPLQTFTMHHGR